MKKNYHPHIVTYHNDVVIPDRVLKEDLKKMGSLSRIKVEREYTWERIAEKTLRVYKTI
jgi:glycosyltransferase involved in cell wall biosynthesis